MKNTIVTISFNKYLLSQIGKTAKEEFRSRSELIREVVRLYIEKKQKWRSIFTYGEKQSIKQGLT